MKSCVNDHRNLTRHLGACVLFVLLTGGVARSDDAKPTVPIIKDGESQIVPGFKDPDLWIRHDLWVETEFDSDDDGRLDRVHVGVTRPRQTESEGLKLPVIYVSSPYFAGTASPVHDYFWDVKHEIGDTPPERKAAPTIKRKGDRPIISKSHTKEWVPRGFAVVRDASEVPVSTAGAVTRGAALEIQFQDGRVDAIANSGGIPPKAKKPRPPKGSQGSLF